MMSTVMALVTVVAGAIPMNVDVSSFPQPGRTVGEEKVVSTHYLGGPRFVRAKVTATQTGGTTKWLMFATKLDCNGEKAYGTQNIYGSGTLTISRVVNDSSKCVVSASSANGRDSSYKLTVKSAVDSQPVSRWSVGHEETEWPLKLNQWSAADVATQLVELPQDTGLGWMKISAGLKVTTCTHPEGSRENGSPNLCTSPNRRGSRVTAYAQAMQLRSSGYGYCRITTIKKFVVDVNIRVHHQMFPLASGATFPVDHSSSCSKKFRIKIFVHNGGPAHLLINRKGTITNAYR